jgi:hypothetical protein
MQINVKIPGGLTLFNVRTKRRTPMFIRWSVYRSRTAWVAAVFIALMAIGGGVRHADAQEDDARKILKAMSDYVASQKTISATFDADVEVITTSLQKIQFTNSGRLELSRPNKLRALRAGGYVDVELVFDGNTATVLSRDKNVYAEFNVTGSIDQLIDKLRDEYNVAIPGADLLLTRPYDKLNEGVIEAKHIGQGVVDGVECEHLAFRDEDTDWQIWVEIGPRPIPRKYVITSKAVASGPQYTLRIKNWVTDGTMSADTFTFKGPAGAKKVDAKDLTDIDEVPAGIIAGGGK